MKRHIIILLITFLCLPEYLEAQLKYYDAAKFPLYGKATKNTENRYERLPDSLKHVSRKPVWNLSRNSAGLAIRFCSNSTTIATKWENLNNNLMNHMTPTGTKGLDLYTWVDGAWRFVNSGRPTGKVNQATIIANMEPVEREYMLYLPLYDGVISLSIGIDAEASISVPRTAIPVRTKPIVFMEQAFFKVAVPIVLGWHIPILFPPSQSRNRQFGIQWKCTFRLRNSRSNVLSRCKECMY